MKNAGSDGIVKTATNEIGQLTGWSVSVTGGTLDATALGATWGEVMAAGIKRWTGSADGYFDFDDAGQTELQVGDELTLNFYYEGETSTNNYLSGSAVITEVQRQAELEGLHEVSFTFEGNGALTDEVVA